MQQLVCDHEVLKALLLIGQVLGKCDDTAG